MRRHQPLWFLALLAGCLAALDVPPLRLDASVKPARPAWQKVPLPPSALKEKPPVEPTILTRLLPYEQWTSEYLAYFKRHYGEASVKLDPRVVVMHYTTTATFGQAWNSFVAGGRMSSGSDGRTTWGHPSVHYMIDTDGTIYQIMPANRRATGTYGVNHVALQVEMVARDEAEILNNRAQRWASYELVRHLMRKFNIPQDKVYGHYQVSIDKSEVPEYLDLADADYPHSYPPEYARGDPGRTYMLQLHTWLRRLQ